MALSPRPASCALFVADAEDSRQVSGSTSNTVQHLISLWRSDSTTTRDALGAPCVDALVRLIQYCLGRDCVGAIRIISLRVSCAGRAACWPLLNSGSHLALLALANSKPGLENQFRRGMQCRPVTSADRYQRIREKRGEAFYMRLSPGCISSDQRSAEKH